MLTELRTALMAQLATTGYPVGTSWPDKLVSVPLPAIWITPPQDGAYIQPDDDPDFAGEFYGIRFDLLLLVAFTDNTTALVNIEQAIENVLTALDRDWRSSATVDFPSTVNRDGVVMMGTLIHLTNEGKL